MQKVLFFLTVLICTSSIHAQTIEADYDHNKLKFGIHTGINYSILHPENSIPQNSNIINGAGFILGILMDYSLSDRLIISPKAEMALNTSSVVTFNEYNNSSSTYSVYPITINFMTHMVYKVGKKKSAPYILIGPEFMLPIKIDENITSNYGTSPNLALSAGLGFEKHFPKFIVSPELRYSMGFRNVNNNPALRLLNYDSVSLVLGLKY